MSRALVPGLLALAGCLTAPAVGVAIDIPGSDASPSVAAPAPEAGTAVPLAAPAPAPAQAAPTAVVAVRTFSLRPGSRGQAVRDLQRELRRRGYRGVRVDGAYGRGTKAAVRSLQKRLKMRVTGIADARLMRRVGLQRSITASAPVAVAQPTVTGAKYLRAFPVLGDYSYGSDFGAARHQGSHEGNDIMAPAGSPVVAVADGTVIRLSRVERGLGGLYVWLRDRAGNEYYYAHLKFVAPGIDEGSRVAVGQVLGGVGQTGDARGTVNHLHFEIHPGGGSATDPNSDLRAVDPKAR